MKRSEGALGWAIVAGLVLMPIGLLLTLMFFMAGVFRAARTSGGDAGDVVLIWIGIATLLIGFLLTVGGFLVGYFSGKKEYAPTGDMRSAPGVQVLVRYAYNKRGEMANDEYMWQEGDDIKFYVKLRFPNGTIQEFQSTNEVYNMCGEGMKGDALIDGRWLCGFTVIIPQPPTS